MREAFSKYSGEVSRVPEKKIEPAELRRRIEKSLEDIGTARAYWVENIRLLKEKFKLDDVAHDETTDAASVLLNKWLGRMFELGELEDESFEDLKTLGQELEA
jgi:hypothetical protein